jgi:hypothetical protein
MNFEEILKEIEKKTNLSKEEILKKVEEKCAELSNLITKEGALYILAKEFGVELPSFHKSRLEIKNIVSGMKNVNLIGRIIRISPINEFERANGKKGRVVNIFVADDSGYVRIPLWNDQTKLVENREIKRGDVIQITNGMARENIFGETEISLGRYGNIRVLEDSGEILNADQLEKKHLLFSPKKIEIKNISPGNYEIFATIVHVFRGDFLFEENGKKHLVISCIADDGTSTLRIVFFRELAEKVCGVKASELLNLDREERYEIIKNRLLGKEMILRGRVRKSKIFDRLEMIVLETQDLNLLEESKKLAEDVEMLLQDYHPEW